MKTHSAATVLLAQRKGSLSHSIRSLLERSGINVRYASSAKQAFELAAPRSDIAILDISLPEWGGYELCRRLKAHPATNRMPIILTSDHHLNRSEILKCFESGAEDYVVHPIPDEELLARITARMRANAMDSRWTNRLLQQQSEASQTRIARLRAALEIAQLGIWELTALYGVWESDVLSASVQFDNRCLDVFGLAHEHPVSLEQLLRSIHQDDRQRLREHLSSAMWMYGSGTFDIECRIMRPDGTERWVAMRGHEVKSELSMHKIVRLVGTMMDITERKHTQELLVRSERVAALGKMAATLAHEINNPLAAVMNTIYLANSCVDRPQDLARFLKLADSELRRVAHITRRALGFYRENSNPMPISVNSLVVETLDLLNPSSKSKNVIFEGSEREFYTIAVPGELRQVLSNLIANSMDATGDDGAIRVRISRCSALRNGHSRIRITVADNGKGIRKSAMPHLFEPLFTTKGVGGTGLGLWVSKQLVEKQGGSIRVRSSIKPQRSGTVFSVYLPTAPLLPEATPIAKVTRQRKPARARRRSA